MEELLRKALAHGKADYIEIRADRRASTSIGYVGREIEQISEFTGLGGGVRALVDGGWGFVSFNDLTDLPRFVRLACEQAAMVGRSTSLLGEAQPVTAAVGAQPTVDPREIPLRQKEALCRQYNDRILAHDAIQTSSVRYQDRAVHSTFISSEGACIQSETVFCGVLLLAIARDGMNVQRGYRSVGDLRGYQVCEGLDEECELTVERAVALLSAEPVKGGQYTVIADPQLAGVFAHEAFGHLSEADFVYENPQLLEIMELGKRFGPEHLSIVDDPTLDRRAGSYAYDSEATPSQRTPLIENGILTSRLHSRETAARMGEAPTGNARAINHEHQPIVRMSNTFIEPRDWELDALIADTGEGLYARGSIGGMTDMEMFTFSAEEAYMIRDGKLAERVREVVLTGNVFETLQNIDAIGNDLAFTGGLGGCGKEGQSPLRVSTGAPHIRIQSCLVGGR
ncbi:TldD/PmbA family protein [bacterium]|nr:TldD/PmbA family protein [bacterium]